MKKLLPLLLLSSGCYLFGLTPPPEAPENSSEIEKNLQDLQSTQTNEATVDKLKVEKGTTGKSKVNIHKKTKFLLRNLKITGDTIYPKKKIVSIVKPYVGKYITIKELKEISQKITDLYHKDGYVTSKCTIPAQQVKNGTVAFKIIEDKLGKIVILGKKAIYYNQNIFMRYLYDLQGKVLNIKELNYRLKLLTYLPVTRVKPVLKKINNSYTALILEIKESKQLSYVSVANGGSKYTGKYRFNVGGSINNIRGVGDSLKMNLLTVSNPKYLGAASFSYITPYGNKGARLVFGYSKMYYQLNPDEVGTDSVIYQGGSDTLSFLYTKPLFVKKLKHSQLNYKLGIEKKSVTSQTVQNSNGDLLVDGEDKTFVLVAGLDFMNADRLFRDYTAVNKISLTLKHGLEGVFGSMTQEDVNRKESDNTFPISGPIKYGGDLDLSFNKIYYSLSRNQKLSKELSLKLSLSGDYTKHRIPRSYEYGGHDWGYSYSLGLSKKLWTVSSSISLSQTIVYDYDTDGKETKDTGKAGVGLSFAKSFGNLALNLSYSSSFAQWNYNKDRVRFSAKYSW